MNIQLYQNRLNMLINQNIYESLTKFLNETKNLDDLKVIKQKLNILLIEVKYTDLEEVVKYIIEKDDITKEEIKYILSRYRYKYFNNFIKLYNESIFFR